MDFLPEIGPIRGGRGRPLCAFFDGRMILIRHYTKPDRRTGSGQSVWNLR